MTDQTIYKLYSDLTREFPHPFDWMSLLEKPPFWKRGWVKAHRRVVEIFYEYGYRLTPAVAEIYAYRHPDEWRSYGDDAGGAICRKLARAVAWQKEWIQ